ncbi:MAG: amidohydrolase [Myxococcales bacterium]|nr:amidohydrolase [Myxococcales bacterium]
MTTAEHRGRLLEAIDREAEEACALARWMAANPELSLVEFETSDRYCELLGDRGFAIERGVADMETAFVASLGASDAPCRVALLAEMDALPEVGHACGHNLSGPASLLASWALRDVVDAGGLRVVVVGCPAEETGVGKKRLVRAGVFEQVDVAMMAHASDMRRAHRLFLGTAKYDLVFRGRAAHAAAYPERGVNALDGAVACYQALSLLRQQLAPGVRVHAIVTDGGSAANVIPETAALQVWVRALEADLLTETTERVLRCAEGAAHATGTAVDSRSLESSSPPLRPSLRLADCYRRQLGVLGLSESAHAPDACIGSSDITHVSEVVPTIHPNFPIGTDLQLHSREFAEAAASADGEAGLLEGACALALTTLELHRDPSLRAEIATDFRKEI